MTSKKNNKPNIVRSNEIYELAKKLFLQEHKLIVRVFHNL